MTHWVGLVDYIIQRIYDDELLFTDLDECTALTANCICLGGLPASCIAQCTNIDGSFECGCVDGYALMADGFTCDSEFTLMIQI
jgi:hypothetical protein